MSRRSRTRSFFVPFLMAIVLAIAGSSFVVHAATDAPAAGLPAGVTLRAVDGGANYYGRWSNSFTTDPNFFPVGVFAETFSDDASSRARIDEYLAMGINLQVGPWGMPDGVKTYLQGKGGYAIDGTSSHPGNAANVTSDEPDWRGCAPDSGNVAAEAPSWLAVRCSTVGSASGASGTGPIAPSYLQAWSDGQRQRDTTRPVWTNFTKVQRPGIATDYWVPEDVAKAYVATADIVSFDWYVLTDAGHYTPAALGNVWTQHDAVVNTRRLANYSKPVWNFIETNYVNDYGTYRPTAADVNAEVWNSLIAGARGFTYFQHDFKLGTTRSLLDARFADIRAQVTKTNAQIKALAPVLNAPYADGLTSVAAGQVNTMTKFADGSYYVFVSPKAKGAQTVSLTFNGLANANVEVIGENRTTAVSANTLTDTFADHNTIHIYKITPASGPVVTTPTTAAPTTTGGPVPVTTVKPTTTTAAPVTTVKPTTTTAAPAPVTTAPPVGSTFTIFGSAIPPVGAKTTDPNAVEVGTKIRADRAVTATGVRFYKGATNTGTHTGHLWSRRGELLAEVMFTNETAAGWQSATFSKPVDLKAGTTYVVSVHMPNGNYAIDESAFARKGGGSGPVRALRNGVDGGNGVYRYGRAGSFPSATWKASNYFIDVVVK